MPVQRPHRRFGLSKLSKAKLVKIILKEVAKIVIVVVRSLLWHLGIGGHGDHSTKLFGGHNAVGTVNDR